MELVQLITMVAAVGTFITAMIAAFNYVQGRRLERAKWTLSLYEKFYERPELKAVREALDNESDAQVVSDLVLSCPPEFTDYLNFFEYVSFLERKNQLQREEVRALFDYYIKCLSRHTRVIKFISDNGYEELGRMLREWK